MDKKEIQIQPMLRLNTKRNEVMEIGFHNSNTTNVKVKSDTQASASQRQAHSNTTNVKVKLNLG